MELITTDSDSFPGYFLSLFIENCSLLGVLIGLPFLSFQTTASLMQKSSINASAIVASSLLGLLSPPVSPSCSVRIRAEHHHHRCLYPALNTLVTIFHFYS